VDVKTLEDLKTVVSKRPEAFRGVRPETSESFAAAEEKLGCALPPSLVWLLTSHGYSSACAIDSLDEAVAITLRCRESIQPTRYILINDWGDAGVVYFDTTTQSAAGEYLVRWTTAYNIQRLAEGVALDSDVDSFDSYVAWVMYRLDEAGEEF
jgi:SMI1 / KNR4 family (SUKH-1)